MLPMYAQLLHGSTTVRLSGSANQGFTDNLGLSKDGIEGWLSSPDSKVQLTERAFGNGAHDVAEPDIDYVERTVTVHWVALGDSRDVVLHAAALLSSACGHIVRFRVVDAGSDTFVTGYVTPKMDATWNEGKLTGTMTIVCPRPERLSWQSHEVQLLPTSRMQGGLSYGAAGKGLYYGPDNKGLSYGLAPGGAQNTGMLVNNGSSTAYPVLTVTGPFPDGVLIQWDGGALEFSGAVGNVPLVLDSRPGARTAFMGGQDVSRQLTRRDFPEIPYGSSISLRLMSSGSGWVMATSRDTFI